MNLYTNLRNLYQSPEYKKFLQHRLIAWRKEPVILKLEHPTRLDRARALGYKAKQGYIVVRVRLKRGGRQRPLIKKGRRSKHRRRMKIVSKNYRQIAEERAARKFTNLTVLNSYYMAKDGPHYWFEIILVDPHHSVIKADKKMHWMSKKQDRVFRGLTAAGKQSRGLRYSGKGHEKMRPSKHANRISRQGS